MTLAEYAAHVAKNSEVFWVEGIPWVLGDRTLRPLTMPHRMTRVPRGAIRGVLKQSGAALAQWTEGWDLPQTDWWYVCCDRSDYDLVQLKKTPRYDVRRGLGTCEVRQLDANWFAENGYPVYAAAFRHYGTPSVLTEEEFVREFRRHGEYGGRETWGAFVGEKLVAWESCIVIDDAAMSASAKSDPAYFKARPNNALVYVLTRHYLRERRLSYVSSGARVLVHDTNVQEFQERMGYRKIFCRLRVELSIGARVMASLWSSRWSRQLGIPRLFPGAGTRLDALARVASIARSFGDLHGSTAP